MRTNILNVLKDKPKSSFTDICKALGFTKVGDQLEVLKEIAALIKEAVITKTVDSKYSLV
jgi:hypothetical protein